MPYTPGQVSEMLKIPGSTIRLYAKLFVDYLSPQTGRKQRLYTEQDILTFARIKDLRSHHTPLDAIGPLLQVEPGTAEPAKPEETALSLVPSIAAEIESAKSAARSALAKLDQVQQESQAHTSQIAQLSEHLQFQTAQLTRLKEWAALPWWKRFFTSPPTE